MKPTNLRVLNIRVTKSLLPNGRRLIGSSFNTFSKKMIEPIVVKKTSEEN